MNVIALALDPLSFQLIWLGRASMVFHGPKLAQAEQQGAVNVDSRLSEQDKSHSRETYHSAFPHFFVRQLFSSVSYECPVLADDKF